MIFTRWAFPQNITEKTEPGYICRSVLDAREQDRRLQDYELLKQQLALKEQQIANLEQQIEIQNKLAELYKKEVEIYKTAFDREKELIDRAIKLAEISKPKSNWEMLGLIGMALFLVGFIAGR